MADLNDGASSELNYAGQHPSPLDSSLPSADLEQAAEVEALDAAPALPASPALRDLDPSVVLTIIDQMKEGKRLDISATLLAQFVEEGLIEPLPDSYQRGSSAHLRAAWDGNLLELERRIKAAVPGLPATENLADYRQAVSEELEKELRSASVLKVLGRRITGRQAEIAAQRSRIEELDNLDSLCDMISDTPCFIANDSSWVCSYEAEGFPEYLRMRLDSWSKYGSEGLGFGDLWDQYRDMTEVLGKELEKFGEYYDDFYVQDLNFPNEAAAWAGALLWAGKRGISLQSVKKLLQNLKGDPNLLEIAYPLVSRLRKDGDEGRVLEEYKAMRQILIDNGAADDKHASFDAAHILHADREDAKATLGDFIFIIKSLHDVGWDAYLSFNKDAPFLPSSVSPECRRVAARCLSHRFAKVAAECDPLFSPLSEMVPALTEIEPLVAPRNELSTKSAFAALRLMGSGAECEYRGALHELGTYNKDLLDCELAAMIAGGSDYSIPETLYWIKEVCESVEAQVAFYGRNDLPKALLAASIITGCWVYYD